jgi:hypothetical protein
MRRLLGCLTSIFCVFTLLSIPLSAQDDTGFPEVAGQQVEIDGGSFTSPGTLELPAAEGPVPCVVFIAGSGPTDRNWNSAMIPGGTGSALLLAEALRQQGVGSIRYDKVGSGVNATMIAGLTLQHFADEGVAAYRYLSGNSACGRLFVLGSSEGGLHALTAGRQLQEEPDFGGVITLSSMTRSMVHTMMEQVRSAAELEDALGTEEIDQGLEVLRAALEGLPETATNPPDFSVFPDLGVLFQTLAGSTAGEFDLLRDLLFAEPVEVANEYRGPALIVSATHDAQIPVSDGDLLFAALPDAGQVRQRVTIENASHVYRQETRSVDDVDDLTVLMLAYWEDDRPLAAGTVESIVAFIREVAP